LESVITFLGYLPFPTTGILRLSACAQKVPLIGA
jgi:hypothetical protein